MTQVADGRGKTLSSGKPSKEKEQLKGKNKNSSYECTWLQENKFRL